MPGSRDGAIARGQEAFDSGRYVRALEALVAVRTESQNPERGAELRRYCAEVLGPMVASVGCTVQVLDNPLPERGPILVGRRIEDAALPTVLVYGHGDVVHGMPERWRAGLDPFRVTVEGERLYGRGTADNKGQHLIALESLQAVLAERGALGFNVTFLVETGEEVGSPGLRAFLQRHRELCAADVFIGLDGPRKNKAIPELSLGARGGLTFDLVLDLREGSHHSGHWGGVLADPGFIMAHALASIVSQDGPHPRARLAAGDRARVRAPRLRDRRVRGEPRPAAGRSRLGRARHVESRAHLRLDERDRARERQWRAAGADERRRGLRPGAAAGAPHRRPSTPTRSSRACAVTSTPTALRRSRSCRSPTRTPLRPRGPTPTIRGSASSSSR
jgi:hypothetical protein